MIRRLPRKLKKNIKKQGLNPALYLKELQDIEQRDKHLARIFTRDYNRAREIVQEAVGLKPQI